MALGIMVLLGHSGSGHILVILIGHWGGLTCIKAAEYTMESTELLKLQIYMLTIIMEPAIQKLLTLRRGCGDVFFM
jgi:hypothetical protein